MIDRLTIDRIMSAADIVDVVGDFVTLRRSGANFKGLCPFHDEKTPSFMVSPAKQLCKCFSCGVGGNAVQFVMHHEQLSYPDALKWLGKRYGIEVREREQTDEEKARSTTREAMFVLNEWARDKFCDTLHNNVEGIAIGMSYFRRRGLRDDIIRKFQLGYSPESRDYIALAAKSKGFEEKYIESTGLCYRTDDHRLLDRYHGRVIFPVHTVSGRVVAFGGRILHTDSKRVGKYVNSPESEIYSKKRELYGLYFAKQAIVKQDRCYLVEGYLDVISMYQNGLENVVSSSGTSLTPEQVRLIHRFTNNVTVIYDGDAAGIRASLRGIDLLLSEGLNIKVLLLPDGEDPDSYAQRHTADDFRQYIEAHQVDFIRFKTDLLMREIANDPTRRAEVIRDIVRSIAVIPSDIVRQVYAHELSAQIALPEEVIVSEIAHELRRLHSERRNPNTASTPPTTAPTTTDSPTAQGDSPSTAPPAPPADSSAPATATPESDVFSQHTAAQRHLWACERQLLTIVLRYGDCPIWVPPPAVERKFGGGSPSNTPAEPIDSPLVAPHILEDLSADGLRLQQPLYQDILEEAAQLATEADHPRSRDYFPLHSREEISTLSAALINDPYQLSTIQQQLYVPEEQRLIDIVPRAINDYKHAILSLEKEQLMHQLRQCTDPSSTDQLNRLMQRLIEINEFEKHFAKILGDRVLRK